MTAWTSPRTWIVGEKLFASLLNTHVRDNLLYVKEVLAGTNTDKIPPAALSLISATVLETQNTSIVTTTIGNQQDVVSFRGADGVNNNSLRAILRRRTATGGYLGTAWRLLNVIDANYAASAYIDIGTNGTAGQGRVALGDPTGDMLTIDRASGISTGLDTSVSGFLIARKNGAFTFAGLNQLVMGWNKSGGGAEVNFYNDRNSPGTAFSFHHWNGSAWTDDLKIGPTGQLTGLGFYDSGQVTITNNTTQTFTTGFPTGQDGPRFVWGLWGTTSVTVNQPVSFGALTNTVHYTTTTSGTIGVKNDATGGSIIAHVWAIY